MFSRWHRRTDGLVHWRQHPDSLRNTGLRLWGTVCLQTHTPWALKAGDPAALVLAGMNSPRPAGFSLMFARVLTPEKKFLSGRILRKSLQINCSAAVSKSLHKWISRQKNLIKVCSQGHAANADDKMSSFICLSSWGGTQWAATG